jgi:hypothetical protein
MKVIKHKDKWYLQSDTGYKEILLSTDTELQKDGVQSIDDEFLEWFIKNPSCERVEVEKGCVLYDFKYKIIIPSEELKQEKQETHEYSLLQHIKFCLECKNESQAIRLIEQYGFYKQEQDKKLYSEEEVIKLLQQYRYDLSSGKTSNIGDTTGLWFEQFKKK